MNMSFNNIKNNIKNLSLSNSYLRLSLLLLICIFLYLSSGAAQLENESTLPKEQYYSCEVLHNVAGAHTVYNYFNYYDRPFTKVYQNTEMDEFDARDEWERTNVQAYANSLEPFQYIYADPNFSKTMTFTTVLSGTQADSISLALGWNKAGSVGWNSDTTKTWSIDDTFSETMSFTFNPPLGILPNTVLFINFFSRFAYRQGSCYEKTQGPTRSYCATHNAWLQGVSQTVHDYAESPKRATAKYLEETRVVIHGKYPHSANVCDVDAHVTNFDVDGYQDPYIQEGSRFYNSNFD